MKKLREILGGVIIGTLLILILVVYLICYNLNKDKEIVNKDKDDTKAYIYIMNDNTIKKSEINSDNLYKDKYKGKYLCKSIECDIFENDIINPIYDDKYIIVKDSDKVFIYDFVNNIKSNGYDNIVNKINEYLIVQENNKEGLIDINGKEVIPCSYDKIDYIYNNLVRVLDNDKYGIYNLNTNKLLIDTKYSYIEISDINYFTVKKEDKYYVIDKYDEVVTDKYSYIFAFNKGYIVQEDNTLKIYNYVDNTLLNDTVIDIEGEFKIERNGNKIVITTSKEYVYDINRNSFK